MTQQELGELIVESQHAYESRGEQLEPWDTPALAQTLASSVAKVVETIIWAIDDTRLPPETIEKRAYWLAHCPRSHVAQTLWNGSKSKRLVSAVVEKLVRIDAIKGELSRRAPGEIGRAILSPSLRETFLEDLPFRSIDSDSETDKNKHQDTWLELAEGVKNIRRGAAPRLDAIHISPLNVFEMPVRLSGPRWRNWPVRQACIVKEVLSSVLPAVSGQVDELIQQLEAYLEHCTTTRPETERRTAGRHKAILRSGGRTDVAEEDTLYQHVRNREAKEDLVKVARTQWGEKTAKAVEYLLEGKNQKESAELANIPYQPFRRNMVKLRKHMSELYR